jgi:hypothetical protein
MTPVEAIRWAPIETKSTAGQTSVSTANKDLVVRPECKNISSHVINDPRTLFD